MGPGSRGCMPGVFIGYMRRLVNGDLMSNDKPESKLVFIPEDADAPAEHIGPVEFRPLAPIKPMTMEELEAKRVKAQQDIEGFYAELDAEDQARVDAGLALPTPEGPALTTVVEPWEAEFLRTIESLTGARSETIDGLLRINKGETRLVEYHTEKRHAEAARMRYTRYKKRLLVLCAQGKVPPPAIRGLRAFSIWLTPRSDGIWELILGHESGRPPAVVDEEIRQRMHTRIWEGKI